ncbi:hypothetical protein SUGI_0294980 [Cryptomeria japonica]|uniref:RING-H2 finger protein ATL39-like n=1 Tax=Cryptomeria japonica TaxID=3369 RepID=UPI002408AFA3|nr:RING-H2 finger protein ATL39-like [Cryptomeria japonica]GLJ17050.1 hypothetical protein SUGI_0294980 [Cryptomeria japonica]
MSFSFQSLLVPCGGTALVVLIYIWLAWHVLRSAAANVANVAIGEGSSKKENGGLSKDDIQKLPTFICHPHEKNEKQSDGDEKNEEQSDDKITEELNISEDLECCVCLEQFKDGDKCLLMPTCKHCFHLDCAGAWLTKRPICPLCRAAALPKEEKDEQHCATSNDHSPHSTVIDMPS